MNSVCRPLLAGLCLLSVLLPGFGASGQFLPQDIIQAEHIEPAMKPQMAQVINPLMDALIRGEAEDISESRDKILRPLRDITATQAFKEAYSELITTRMNPAVNHASDRVRMNAMIILASMTDAGSEKLINGGLLDKSVAVKRWAMQAQRRRVQTWIQNAGAANKVAPGKLAGVITQVKAYLDQKPAPHPIVVKPGLLTFCDMDTPDARAAVIEVLNSRLAIHAADANLSSAGEQAVFERLAPTLAIARPAAPVAVKGLSRAAFRYSVLIVSQAKAGAIKDDNLDSALATLNQSLQALAQLAGGAGKTPPPAQAQANDAILKGRWDDLQRLLNNDWAPILRAAPFGLNNEELGLE